MRFQIFSTLGKCLRMRTYLSDILQFSIRQSQKYMLRTDDLFSYNAKLILCKKIMAISRKRQYQLLTEHGIEDDEKLEMVDALPLKDVRVVFQGVEGASTISSFSSSSIPCSVRS